MGAAVIVYQFVVIHIVVSKGGVAGSGALVLNRATQCRVDNRVAGVGVLKGVGVAFLPLQQHGGVGGNAHIGSGAVGHHFNITLCIYLIGGHALWHNIRTVGVERSPVAHVKVHRELLFGHSDVAFCHVLNSVVLCVEQYGHYLQFVAVLN